MNNNIIPLDDERISSKIYTIRGEKVILDYDLAELYNVETRTLNQAVKRNIERFPSNFMFKLPEEEFKSIRSQNVILENKKGKHRKYLPNAFTEQGIAMLAGVLKSKTAVKVSIQIVNAFVCMRKYIASNSHFSNRINNIERKQIEYEINFKKIFEALESNEIKKEQGVFFDGQIFDAHRFISNLIKSAEKSIILIDNYIDDSVLTLFSERNKNVKVVIYTKNISKKLMLDLEKYNTQYASIEIREFNKSHDRFLILDDHLYHFGASLKDLGKKWFAFSKFKENFLKDKL